jgi:hypothetical protein
MIDGTLTANSDGEASTGQFPIPAGQLNTKYSFLHHRRQTATNQQEPADRYIISISCSTRRPLNTP